MDYTIVEKYQQNKNKTIAIRPFFNKNKQNMGLENYGMSLYEGVWHEESLACLELNGVKRYVTGLNEFAPEVKRLPDSEKELKIKEIRRTVVQLEAELAANVIDPEDKDFWNKVTLLKPDNHKFWSRISIRCGNDPVFLDPASDPYDLIKIFAINAGGFSIVAKSLKDAKQKQNIKFYLDQVEETVNTRTEYTKLKNKAISELQKLYDKNINKLFYVAKVVDVDSFQYTKSTPNDILYENMDLFIAGDSSESGKIRAAELFLEAVNSTMEDLKLKCIVKDAIAYKFITSKPNGWLEHTESSSKLGKNISEVIMYLKDPLNEEVFKNLMVKVEQYWK